MADDETHIGRNNEERKEDENRRIMGKALEGVAAGNRATLWFCHQGTFSGLCG